MRNFFIFSYRPQAERTLFLKNAQQLGLRLQGQIAHLFEEKRSLVAHFNFSGASFFARARKSAQRVAEPLGFKEFLGNGRAVDARKRAFRAGAGVRQTVQ